MPETAKESTSTGTGSNANAPPKPGAPKKPVEAESEAPSSHGSSVFDKAKHFFTLDAEIASAINSAQEQPE
jgi:hypothetical protein